MRALLAGLLAAAIVIAIALITAVGGALGVAAIGWLLHRWFDLSQWQGSLIALAVAIALGWLLYKLVTMTPLPSTGDEDWEEDWDEDEDEEEEIEPPIVAWRRQRPTQGALPPEKGTGTAAKPPSKRK